MVCSLKGEKERCLLATRQNLATILLPVGNPKLPLPGMVPSFWGNSQMPTHKGLKCCSLWAQNFGVSGFWSCRGSSRRGGWDHQWGPILQIPQFYPLWLYFLEGGVWKRCAAGLRLAFLLFLLFLRKGVRPRVTFVSLLILFSHVSEAWSPD